MFWRGSLQQEPRGGSQGSLLPCWRAPGAGHDWPRLGTGRSRVASPCREAIDLACGFLRRSPTGQGMPAEGEASHGTRAKGLS
ncbi:hypothetical protein E2320_009396 [Naja naja]|nr:hypothetical protein E2320_009396 [Naja naja]